MAYRVENSCIGCGGCEFGCSRGAISQTDEYPVFYAVDPLLCDDCGECTKLCPVDALVPDPSWATCYGHGCPLSSSRYQGWVCSTGQELCPECGSMMWKSPGGKLACSRCRLGDTGRGATCPKVRKAEQILRT